MTLPEALATLDAHTCNDNSCMFATAKRGGMGTNGGCDCIIRGRPFIAPALAAVVKAARESVAASELERASSRLSADERADVEQRWVQSQLAADPPPGARRRRIER